MGIFRSRKFWLMVVDLVVSMASYFVGKYVAPDASKDILFLIGALQPVVISVIVGISMEDSAEKGNVALVAGPDR